MMRKTNVSCRILQWKVCSTLIYFICLEALLWNWCSVEIWFRLMTLCLFLLSYICHIKLYWALCYSALKGAVCLHYCTQCLNSYFSYCMFITVSMSCLLMLKLYKWFPETRQKINVSCVCVITVNLSHSKSDSAVSLLQTKSHLVS